jgi:DNA-binding transcriptional MerR regulator
VNWQTQSTPGEGLDSDADETLPEGGGPEPGLQIGEVCRRTGLSARTVRYYEELGLLPGVRRRAGGRRVYDADELERLRFIRRLKTLGLALSEIKRLNALYALGGSTHAMLEHLMELLAAHASDLEGRIEELAGLRDEMTRYREHIAARIEQLAETGETGETSETAETRDEEER